MKNAGCPSVAGSLITKLCRPCNSVLFIEWKITLQAALSSRKEILQWVLVMYACLVCYYFCRWKRHCISANSYNVYYHFMILQLFRQVLLQIILLVNKFHLSDSVRSCPWKSSDCERVLEEHLLRANLFRQVLESSEIFNSSHWKSHCDLKIFYCLFQVCCCMCAWAH